MENKNNIMQDNKEPKITETVEILRAEKKHIGKNVIENLAIALLIATTFIVGVNAFQLSQLKPSNLITGNVVSLVNTYSNNPSATVSNSRASGNNIPDIVPKGIPDIYGKELGISFDDVSGANQQKADQTIRKVGALDNQISLSGKDNERYISIAGKISCEYCCGVESIIDTTGRAACGCAHSYAMRGLAKYLIKNHNSEYSDDEILEELGKWKTLFFPAQITKKAEILNGKGIELSYINLASNKYRGIESSGNTASSAQIDTTGWSEDEKMMYEHHGTLPARIQGSQPQQNMVGGC